MLFRSLCVSDGNRYLEAALLLDEDLDVEVVAPNRYAGATGYDAVIFDRALPPGPPGVAALYLDPHGQGASPLETAGELERPIFEKLDAKHEILRYTALRDVNVSHATLVHPAKDDQVLAADNRGPLLVAGRRDDQRFVALAFDVRESDLPLRAGWPLLLLNTLDWLTAQARDEPSATSVGKTLELVVPRDLAHAELVAPDGQRSELAPRDGKLPLHPLRTGFYRVRTGDAERVVAVNLAPDVPHELSPRPQLRLGDTLAGRPVQRPAGTHRPPWMLLLLGVVLLLGAEWATYHRRLTV